MDMFLKFIVIWLLIFWHKEKLSAHCSMFVAPIRNPPDRKVAHILVNGVAMNLYPIPSTTDVMEQSTFSERLDRREGNRSLKEFLLKLYNETFLYGNRSTIKDLKGVVYEPEIVPQEDVYSNTEGYGSTDESTNQDGHISSSLNNKPTPASLSTEDKELDVTNYSILPSEPQSIRQDFNTTQYAIPVAILIFILLIFAVFSIIYYKKVQNSGNGHLKITQIIINGWPLSLSIFK
jgi:hypothetical protein